MARPSEERTITKRFRVNAAEDARLKSDAAEATKGDESALIRKRIFDGQPLVTGKGLTRPELREGFEITTTLLGKLEGLDADVERDAKQLADLFYNALKRHDP